MKRITLTLDPQSIAQAEKAVKEYKSQLQEKITELLRRLAERGVVVADVGFASAQYDGTNDVKVEIVQEASNIISIVASGQATLFIEFGTGVFYPTQHPQAGEHGMQRGAYGKGRGKGKTWGYYGEAGTHGEVKKTTDKGDLVLTHGNPPNMPMYNSFKEVCAAVEQVAKEVFT